MESTTKSIEIYESYVGRGAPSNRSGQRRGYGLTRDAALEAASHWANQAPWAKTRKIVVSDREKPVAITTRDEEIAWAVCGIPGEFVPATDAEKRRAELIRNGKFATAILDALTK